MTDTKAFAPAKISAQACAILLIAMGVIRCTPIPDFEIPKYQPVSDTFKVPKAPDVSVDDVLNPYMIQSHRGASIVAYTMLDPLLVQQAIHSTSFYGRSTEQSKWQVATTDNLQVVPTKLDDGWDSTLAPKKFIYGANLGCDQDTIENLQAEYVNLKFEDFQDGFKTDFFAIDFVCIQGWHELRNTEKLLGKTIELHDAHLVIQEDVIHDSFILGARNFGLYGQSSILMMSSPRESKKEDIERMSNRRFGLVFVALFGEGQLEVQSYGEDAVGFKAK